MFPQIPFTPGTPSVTGYSADKGKKFCDKDGNTFVLQQCHTAFAGAALADGYMVVFITDGVVSDDVSAAEDATNPRFGGIACGATLPSTGATEATIFYDLFQISGRKTGVKAAASIAIGDGLSTSLVGGGTPVDSEVQRLPKANDSDSTLLVNLTSGFVGQAVSATSSGTITAQIHGHF